MPQQINRNPRNTKLATKSKTAKATARDKIPPLERKPDVTQVVPAVIKPPPIETPPVVHPDNAPFTPTIGRIVHYYGQLSHRHEFAGPLAALVVAVHDATEVNLVVFDNLGYANPMKNITRRVALGTAGWEPPPRV